jgi:hypothetical protein
MEPAIIAMIAIRAKYIRIFKAAGATAPRQAIVPEEHRIRKSLVFNNMVREGVIIPVQDRYYLDERRAIVMDRGKQKILLLVSSLILLLLFLSLLGQRFWN